MQKLFSPQASPPPVFRLSFSKKKTHSNLTINLLYTR